MPAEGGASLRVTVCHALPDRIWQEEVVLAAGATLADAIAASGFREAFPALDPWAAGVGVYGVQRDPGHALADGDRVEIYRTLVFDPMESRRRRARHREARRSGGRQPG